jgi:hypothetical protein
MLTREKEHIRQNSKRQYAWIEMRKKPKDLGMILIPYSYGNEKYNKARYRALAKGESRFDIKCADNEHVSKTRKTWAVKDNLTIQQLLLQKQFYEFAKNWKEEVAGYSTTNRITNNANYKYIMSMGEKVLPFIFEDLIQEPHYWFEALKYITRTDPVPNRHYGDIYKMSEDWIKWGRENNYIE